MVRSFRRLGLPVGLTVAVFSVAMGETAWAVPPANDSRDLATVITALPFADTLDTTEATVGPEDDAAAANCDAPQVYPKSVWYRYTPSTDQAVWIDTDGSDYSVAGGVGTGDSCLTTFVGAGGFLAQANQTYTIALVDFGSGTGGSLQLSVDTVDNEAPVCDDIALTVQTGRSVEVPYPDCADADEDFFDVFIVDEPTKGVYDYDTGLYTPAAGFTGKDSMTFQAVDQWGAESELGVITITVTPAPMPQPGARPQPGPSPQSKPPPDLTAPNVGLLAPSSLALRTALRRGLRFTVTTNELSRIVVRAFVNRQTARRLKIKKNANGPVVVGSLERDIAAGTTVVKVKLSRKARPRLQRASRVKLRIVASIADSAGNVRRETLNITLKRPPSQ